MGRKELVNKGWGEMSDVLDKEMPLQKNKKRFIWLFFFSTASAIAILLTLNLFYQQNTSPSKIDDRTIVDQSLITPENNQVTSTIISNSKEASPPLAIDTFISTPNDKNLIATSNINFIAKKQRKRDGIITTLFELKNQPNTDISTNNDNIIHHLKNSTLEKEMLTKNRSEDDVKIISSTTRFISTVSPIADATFMLKYNYDIVPIGVIIPIENQNIKVRNIANNEVYLQLFNSKSDLVLNGEFGWNRYLFSHKKASLFTSLGFATNSIPIDRILNNNELESLEDKTTEFPEMMEKSNEAYLKAIGFNSKRTFEFKLGLGLELDILKKVSLRNQVDGYFTIINHEFSNSSIVNMGQNTSADFSYKTNNWICRSFHSIHFQVNKQINIYGGIRFSLTPDAEYNFSSQPTQSIHLSQIKVGSSLKF